MLAGVALLIAVAAVMVLSFWVFGQIEKAADAQKHTFVVLNLADDLLSELIDAETGQRGYLLTGDKAFLKPYLAVSGNIRGHLKELRQLSLISAAHKHLDALAPLIDAKLANLSHSLTLRRNNNMTALSANVFGSKGQPLMDLIRAEMKSFTRIEQGALAQHDAEFQANMRRLFIVIVAASLLALLFALSFTYLIYRETQHRLLEAVKISEHESREYSESIINTVREPLIALDHNLRVVTVSRSFYEVFNVKPEETMGQLIYDLGNKQWDIPKLRELLEKILPQRTTFDNYEVEHDFADIGRRTMLLNARQIKSGLGKERIILLAIEDITERKKVEEILKELSEKKSVFVANVSHEFKNPLGIIRSSLELVTEGSTGEINEKQKTLLGTARNNIERLIRLTTNLLDISKIEAGKVELKREKIEIGPLVDEIVANNNIEISKKQLTVKKDIPQDIGLFWADKDKVTEVIVNLLSNAIKYTPSAGAISIKLSGTGEEIRFEISDTGEGITKENIEKLFDKYERIFAEKQEGTGLGLSIAKDIVELHKGKIWAESDPGKGSRFIFVLPRDPSL